MFRHLRKRGIIQKNLTLEVFLFYVVNGFGNHVDDTRYIFCVFDGRYQETFTSPEPKKRTFEFQPRVPAGPIEHSVVLPNRLFLIVCDGQSYFDLIWTRFCRFHVVEYII